MALDKSDCKSVAYADIPLKEVLDYPSNKLHGSVMLNAVQSSRSTEQQQATKIVGTLDYWFKLHAAGII